MQYEIDVIEKKYIDAESPMYAVHRQVQLDYPGMYHMKITQGTENSFDVIVWTDPDKTIYREYQIKPFKSIWEV